MRMRATKLAFLVGAWFAVLPSLALAQGEVASEPKPSAEPLPSTAPEVDPSVTIEPIPVAEPVPDVSTDEPDASKVIEAVAPTSGDKMLMDL
ncbi:MAG: hypothetical protein MUC50_07240, partial [Myxococcota bacterium]|nr:hypothetical protein [Myxococcota bacterium]